MNQLHVNFFGTHTFACEVLATLVKNPSINIDLVVTQPDRPVGRKKEITPPPVKLFAEKYDMPISQPASLKTFVSNSNVDLNIVAQYGLLIPKDVLDAPRYGTINVHTSLLPLYRGASPIQHALLNGDTYTGVTIMKMDEGLDTGPVLSQKKVKIMPDETYPDLDKKLAIVSGPLLLDTIEQYVSGDISPKNQDNAQATTCHKLTRDDGRIDWNSTAQQIYNQFRGLTPWPGVWTVYNDKRLKILSLKPSEVSSPAGLVTTDSGILRVGTTDGSIIIDTVQPESKNIVSAQSFIAGNREIHNTTLS